MGFSIGSLIGGLAPIIGGLFGGPAGAAIGTVIGGAFSSRTGPTATAIPAVLRIPSLTRPPGPGAAGSLFGRDLMNLGTIAAILALSRQKTGRPATTKKIREAARVCGMEIAAETFGISVQDVCTIIVSRRSRRGRGISAADLRRTRSTIRKITTMQHSLAHFVSHQKRGAHGRFA